MKLGDFAALCLMVGLVATAASTARAEIDPVTQQELGNVGVYDSKPVPRATVPFETSYKPGTIVVNTTEKRLYLVLEDGKALRYGIGVGREGKQFAGQFNVSRKAEWPGWTPTAEMRAALPSLPTYMEGGPMNPLGARALYIGSTLYRIHGTNIPWSVGREMSSGCIRMKNEDVIDLYERVNIGAQVVVLQ